MNHVYDASFIGALIIPDEKNIKVGESHLVIYKSGEIFIPQLLWYEIANIFNNLIRRKRYTYENTLEFTDTLSSLKLTTDFQMGADYSVKLLRLSNEYNLSSYDAAYLELADRKKAILCTLDDNLKTAAQKHGVTVLGEV